MLTEEQRKKFKDLVGNHYTNSIMEKLKEQKITNKNGKPYSAHYIRMVFNGYRRNFEIEKVIMELMIELSKEREILLRQLKNLEDQ